MGHFSCPPTNTDKKICRYLNNFVTLPTKKRNNLMKSLSIKDTTLEERRQIVQEALNFGAGYCDGQDLSDIYDDYILGLKELAAATKSSPMYAASSISSNSNNKKLNLELRS